MMIKNRIAVLLAILCLLSVTTSQARSSVDPNKQLLPSPFPIYSDGKIAVNHPVPSPEFKQILIPTVNNYRAAPGCYVICYSHQRSENSYKVSEDIYAVGQIRVAGQYRQRVCMPTHYANRDISALDHFKQLCNTQIDACKNSGDCWAGGDTGGWFGIQP